MTTTKTQYHTGQNVLINIQSDYYEAVVVDATAAHTKITYRSTWGLNKTKWLDNYYINAVLDKESSQTRG